MPSPLFRPGKLAVAGLAVGEQCCLTAGHVEAEDLKPFPATNVFAKEEVVSSVRLVAGLGNAVGEKRKLGAGSARLGDPVNLVGVAETCAYQDLPPLPMPAPQQGRTELRVAISPLGI